MREGWTRCRVGDVCAVNPDAVGGAAERDDLISYIDISAVETGRVKAVKEVTFGDAPSRARRLVQPGDILVSTVRPNLRAFARVPELPGILVASTGFAVVRPYPGVEPEFIFQSMLSDPFVEFLNARVAGSNYPAVRSEDVSAAPLQLPPLDEQRRIAAVLSAIDATIGVQARVVQALHAALDSLVEELGAEGHEVRLGDLIAEGPANGIYKPAHLIGEGALLVGMTALSGQIGVEWAQSRRAEVQGSELARYGLRADDVLVRRVYARVEGVGLPVLVPTAPPEPAVFESNMMRVRLDRERAVPRVVVAAMHSRMVRRQVEEAATLAAQASINAGALRALRIRLPGMHRQREAARLLDSIDRRVVAERDVEVRLRSTKAAACQTLLGEIA